MSDADAQSGQQMEEPENSSGRTLDNFKLERDQPELVDEPESTSGRTLDNFKLERDQPELVDEPESTSGRTLHHGEYQVKAVLGQGKKGQVLLASHTTSDELRVLKQVQTDQQPPEALLLTRLRHTAIPNIYDTFFEESCWYLAIEYIPGETLATYLRRQAPLPPREALMYALQLCDVLDYLHAQSPPVILCNLQPSKVILTSDGHLKLADLSMARYLGANEASDTTEVGSSGYVAPEQLAGRADRRSDLFSLGMMLHEMISGLSPVEKAEAVESLHQINPDVSPVLSGMVHIATRPEPMHRFQSTYTFHRALQRAYVIEERRAYQQRLRTAEAAGQPSSPAQQPPTQAAAEMPREQHEAQESHLAAIDEHLRLRSVGAVAPTPKPLLEEQDYQGTERQVVWESGTTPKLFLREQDYQDGGKPGGIPAPQAGGPRPHQTRRYDTTVSNRRPADPPPVSGTPPRTARRIAYLCFLLALLLSLLMAALLVYESPYHSTSWSPPRKTRTATKTSTATTVVNLRSAWRALPSLPSPEADNTAVYVQVQGRGYVYMSGGYRGHAPNYDRTLYRYDVAAARWQAVTNGNFPGMVNNAVALDEQNQLFFAAGYSSDVYAVTSLLYMYRTSDGVLQKIVPPAGVSIGFGVAMVADQQGHLYMTQGFLKPGDPQARAGTGWYRYDIASGHWQVLTPLPIGLGYVALAADGAGGIMLLGGAQDAGQHLPSTRIYRYDITGNTWAEEQAVSPLALSGAASCTDGHGEMVIVGGSAGYAGGHERVLGQSWLVDLQTLRWQPLAALPTGGSLLGAAACDGEGHAFLVRGANDAGHPTADFWGLTIG